MRLSLLATLAIVGAVALAAGVDQERQTLRGKVIVTAEDAPTFLETADGARYELVAEPDHAHTFHDPLLKDRQWEIEGFLQEGGRLEVREVFTIKDGKRLKVTYYCEICHIVSFRPGRCMCCQEPVELREVPAPE